MSNPDSRTLTASVPGVQRKMRVSRSIVIDAPTDVVYQVVSDISERDRYSPCTESVQLVGQEKDSLVADVLVRLAGRLYTQRIAFNHRPMVCQTFEQIAGPARALRGRTTLHAVTGGTWLEHSYEIEWNTAKWSSGLTGFFFRSVLRRETEGLLRAYKEAAERKWLAGHRPVAVPPLARRSI